jgi:hypothetical protein
MKKSVPCCAYEEEIAPGMSSNRDYGIGRPGHNGRVAKPSEYNAEDSTKQVKDGLVSRRPL